MQTLASLWFDLLIARESLRESFPAGEIADSAANLIHRNGIKWGNNYDYES
jgi:hypothetical protein